ncbi:P-type conjugative transfer ATPase TrbB [Acidocella aminolytica]|uniref:Conjugal transfer protein TrbB n=1 Tax=Acidocella aminolytica 101 = DSM 11237 TaxID=1120923 RepID=A0A0D6PFC4_9PROT|nr:P-type conjugative transfer ATPase TrbB [Acidocella aminolytica]GAN80367.1 conjugal transfer protein TrbB [Acidocella aminolytica 101 = DSM 11237]GBQ33718.1 Flp pilus assembly protein CpaF [Acidocella aminolytica 101 = DSM 11237]SHF60482.1 type IV secretion system protein VirB11 [Acidocella aminolytica 101 = DSM 11237]
MSASREVTQRVHDKLRRELGPLVCDLLSQDDVIEIILNADGRLWAERLGQPMVPVGTMLPGQAESLMATVASTIPTTLTRDSPMLECELPLDGSRFSAVIPPVVEAPCFSIRVPAKRIFPLETYRDNGIISARQMGILTAAIADRKNILVSGGTGSGKTTFANAIIDYIARVTPEHRLAILEDTRELQCASQNVIAMRTSEPAPMDRLLRHALRQRPDRIIVGEVRDRAALTLLKSWTTGHPGGVATVHSNVDDPRAALRRMEFLVAEAFTGSAVELIGEAVDVIVTIAKTKEGARRVQGIATVAGWNGTSYDIEWDQAA